MTEFITQTEVGKRLNLSHTTVKKHTKNGVLPRVTRGVNKGKYKWPDCKIAFREFVPEEVSQAGQICNDPETLVKHPEAAKLAGSMSNGRTMKVEYEAKLQRLKFEKEEGNLLDRAAIEQAGRNLVKLTRARLLEVPNRVAAQVFNAENIGTVEDLIQNAIIEALEELSAIDEVANG